jgi:sterol desaturase/sphingolipid hydroxylase (fatty acid hydroxylase superfamily)
MSTYLITGIVMILIFSGFLMALFQWLAIVKMPEARIRPPKPNKVTMKTKVINVTVNSIVAIVFVFATLYFGGEMMVYSSEDMDISFMTVFGEAIFTLLVYDFMYYWVHRWMHIPKYMKAIHGIHHYICHPTAFESVYVHPIECIIGIGLLLLAIFMVGGIADTSFLSAFFIYSSANILVHGNVRLEHRAFKLANYWAVRHDIHHGVSLNKNYASIFPFYDQFFDTNELPKEAEE